MRCTSLIMTRRPVGALLLIGQPDIRNGKGVELVHRLARIARAPGRLTAGADHLDVRGAQPAEPHATRQDARDLRRAQARVEAPALATAHEAIEVRVDAEKCAIPDRDHVIGRVRTQKAPVGDRNGRLCDRHILAPDIRHAILILRRTRHHRSPVWTCRQAPDYAWTGGASGRQPARRRTDVRAPAPCMLACTFDRNRENCLCCVTSAT